MSINKFKINNIEIEVSTSFLEYSKGWWEDSIVSLLRDNLSSKGTLRITDNFGDQGSFQFWLERAMKRKCASAVVYVVNSQELRDLDWLWSECDSSDQPEKLPVVSQGRKKTLFLDRDGVINIDESYVFEIEKFNFMEGIFDLLEWAKVSDYQVIVLTNQSGVGRGYYSEEDIRKLHKWVDGELSKSGLSIAGWFYSPFHPDSIQEVYKKKSYCRKPGAGMAVQASEKLSIDFKKSLMVGDKLSDRLNGLDIPTFFLKGAYDLEDEKSFLNHSELLKYLRNKFS